MALPPSSSARRARELLAGRLRDIRLDARLNARELSAAAGWHPAKTSRIESGRHAPGEDDIRAWCRVCGAERDIPDLIAASRDADLMYTEWRRMNRGGLRSLQERRRPLHERTRLYKAYCPSVVPGFLQVPGYARALLSAIAAFREIPDDVTEAVAARMDRNRILGDGTRRFVFLAEETVLRYRVGGADVMAAQLSYLLETMRLPGVSLGVIPSAAPERPMWPLEQFTIFDDENVHVELLSAQVTVTAPGETALYVRAFENLAGLAVFGREAAALITAARDALG